MGNQRSGTDSKTQNSSMNRSAMILFLLSKETMWPWVIGYPKVWEDGTDLKDQNYSIKNQQ